MLRPQMPILPFRTPGPSKPSTPTHHRPRRNSTDGAPSAYMEAPSSEFDILWRNCEPNYFYNAHHHAPPLDVVLATRAWILDALILNVLPVQLLLALASQFRRKLLDLLPGYATLRRVLEIVAEHLGLLNRPAYILGLELRSLLGARAVILAKNRS